MKFPGYRIERLLGKGGMATVYLAVQESLRRPVALKVMDRATTDTPEFSRRFLHEGRVLATLNHSNIITIHDMGVADGLLYISMEYVGGGDLKSRIADGITPEAALDITETIAKGLRVAHHKDIIHRDVKPANILFREDGTPLLSDFGVAKSFARDADITEAGAVFGSVYYLSPEQAAGEQVDARADIYSLGIVFYEMLTGTKPYQGDSYVTTIIKHLQEPIPELPGELARFQGFLNRMIAKQRRDRFENVAAMLRFMQTMQSSGASPSLHIENIAIESVSELKASPADGPVLYDVEEMHADDETLDNRIFYQIYQDYMHDKLEIPSLPDVGLRIRKAVEDPNVNVARITRLIQADPALAAHVVRVANSALYRRSRSIQSPQNAIARLGLTATRDIVIGFTLRSLFEVRHTALKERMRELWRHSVVVGTISLVLGRLTRGIDPERALLAGLLHDVGSMVLLARAASYPELLSAPAELEATIAKLRGQVGAMVLRKWNFSSDLVAVALEAETWDRDPGQKADLCDIVLLSQLHSYSGTPRGKSLPRIDAVPAYGKITVPELTPQLNLQVVHEARAELNELRRMLLA